MKSARFLFALALTVAALFAANPQGVPVYAGEYKTITDMCGNTVEIPANPQRIASMHCVSCERIYILGAGSRLCLMGKQSPWAYKLYPEIRNIETERTGKITQLKDLNVDLVLYTTGMFKGKGEEFRKAGFRTACAFTAERRPRTVEGFIADFKKQMRFYGQILGPEVKARAERYCKYFDDRVGRVLSITSKIDMKDRPTVYYGWKSGKMLASQGEGSTMHWNTEIAGGNYLPRAKDDNFADLDRKLVLSWDPDVVLISRANVTIDSVKKDPAWASKKAVRNGRVHYTPEGVYSWDNASGETVLFIIYLAKTLHPDLFKDWDMVKEMKSFYSEIYGKTITDEDARRILQCLPPA